MLRRARLAAYTYLLLNTLIWALSLPIVKLAFNNSLTPSLFLFARFFLAATISIPIIIYILRKHRPQLRKILHPKTLLTIIILETLGATASLWLLYEGLSRTGAINASLIGITWPVFVTLGGILFLKENEEKHEWLGLILAIIGTVILVIRPFLEGNSVLGLTTGNLFIFTQNIVIAAYYLLAKKYYRHLNKWVITHISFWISAVSFAAILLIKTPPPQILSQLKGIATFQPTPLPLIAITYMAILGSILGLTFYLLGQDKIEASEASLFSYLQPLFAIPAAILLLNEKISVLEIASLAIIILGVYLAEKR